MQKMEKPMSNSPFMPFYGMNFDHRITITNYDYELRSRSGKVLQLKSNWKVFTNF